MEEIKAPKSKGNIKYLGEVGVLRHVYDLSKMVQGYWQAGRTKNRLALLTQASATERARGISHWKECQHSWLGFLLGFDKGGKQMCKDAKR